MLVWRHDIWRQKSSQIKTISFRHGKCSSLLFIHKNITTNFDENLKIHMVLGNSHNPKIAIHKNVWTIKTHWAYSTILFFVSSSIPFWYHMFLFLCTIYGVWTMDNPCLPHFKQQLTANGERVFCIAQNLFSLNYMLYIYFNQYSYYCISNAISTMGFVYERETNTFR